MMVMNNNREIANDIHQRVVESIYKNIKNLGINMVIKKENDLKLTDFAHKDLCISIGKN